MKSEKTAIAQASIRVPSVARALLASGALTSHDRMLIVAILAEGCGFLRAEDVPAPTRNIPTFLCDTIRSELETMQDAAEGRRNRRLAKRGLVQGHAAQCPPNKNDANASTTTAIGNTRSSRDIPASSSSPHKVVFEYAPKRADTITPADLLAILERTGAVTDGHLRHAKTFLPSKAGDACDHLRLKPESFFPQIRSDYLYVFAAEKLVARLHVRHVKI